jgi:hypothetical protein
MMGTLIMASFPLGGIFRSRDGWQSAQISKALSALVSDSTRYRSCNSNL